MIDRRGALTGLATGAALGAASASSAATLVEADAIVLSSAAFRVVLDRRTGGLLSITHPRDAAEMSWIGGLGNAPWQPRGSLWGLGCVDLGGERLHRVRWGDPSSIQAHGATGATVVYRLDGLEVTVSRTLADDAMRERFTFRNTGTKPLALRASRGLAALAIYTPCNDHYTTAADVLQHRCHAHIWTGGASSWIAMLRMGGRAPHLGLVLTEGALDGYGIEDRDLVTLSNTRGTIVVHPAIDELAPGESRTIAWTLFWHDGWERFFAEAARRSAQMVRIDAEPWTALADEATTLRFASLLGPAPTLMVDGRATPLRRERNGWAADLPPGPPGERRAELTYGDGVKTHAVLHTALDLPSLVAARVRFITRRQQWSRPGDPWDGAYIIFDNEADVPARWETSNNLGPGQERLAMSVLVARWLARDGNDDPVGRASLERCYAFVRDRLQRADGFVFAAPGVEQRRLYNWPWVMQLHLAMARLRDSRPVLERAVATADSFYREGGEAAYVIGLPVTDMLRDLQAAGMTAAHDRMLALFVAHGERIAARGTDYPPHEVNFEQSIVAPAAIILLQLHAATGEARWLEAARPHVEMLDLFEGRQPDHRLHGVAIRHWDGYWFGKARMWGDTFPHYWSSLNALAWSHMARATGDQAWAARAQTTLRANLSLFAPDGRASCAYIYPDTVDGRTGRFADAYANDQDWALVHALEMGTV